MIVYPVILKVVSAHPERTPERIAVQRETARRALIESACRSGAPIDGYATDSDGVPIPNNGWYWSITHKRKYAAAVVARERIGIDVELIAPRDADTFAAIGSEAEWLLIGDKTPESFARFWTAKEAVCKTVGLGFAAFDRCQFKQCAGERWIMELDGTRWQVAHLLHDGHLFAVAGEQLEVEWHDSRIA